MPIKEINNSEKYKEAYQICMTCLTRREYSRLELFYKLSKKEFSSETVERCLDNLVEKNYQSDYRYAEMLISARTNKKYGPSKIKMELKQKGIGSDIIEDFIDEKDKVWLENIKLLVNKKLKNITDLNDITDLPLKETNKIKRYLMGKGYSFDLINKVIK